MDHRSELSSSASMMEEHRLRLADAATDYRSAKREDVAHELEEVERLLRTAARRLNRLLDSMG